ncbi:DUF1559 domain-containing protein [Singulisphaera sp. Ch08]|uniref:DUF1559 domain-containing protein n=1 Tax=Singulisphaera sp. Ch08 TaxID=3120278 RepID=A0AAU7CAR0_9BACT
MSWEKHLFRWAYEVTAAFAQFDASFRSQHYPPTFLVPIKGYVMQVTNGRRSRAGFTRVDLVVTAGLSFTAFLLVIPSVLASRQDAAREKCRDNLRTLGQGFLQFETANGGFPARRAGFNNGSPYGGWGSQVLPFIGKPELSNAYNSKLDFFDPANKAVTETHVDTFLCPAAPGNHTVEIQSQATAKSLNPDKDTVFTAKAGAVDYISSNGTLLPRGGYAMNQNDLDQGVGNQRQPLTDNDYTPLTKISDGMSSTLLLIEQAGRPDVWRLDKKKEGAGQFGMSPNARGSWAGWGSIAFGPASATTGESPGKGDATDCTVNCNNWFGIYGFHEGGAHVLFCDGSVRFVGTGLDPLTFLYLTNCNDGHVVSQDDF